MLYNGEFAILQPEIHMNTILLTTYSYVTRCTISNKTYNFNLQLARWSDVAPD